MVATTNVTDTIAVVSVKPDTWKVLSGMSIQMDQTRDKAQDRVDACVIALSILGYDGAHHDIVSCGNLLLLLFLCGPCLMMEPPRALCL